MDFKQLVEYFVGIGLKVIPLLGVVALFVFMVGIGRFIRTSGQSKDADKGMLTYGLIGLFVLVTIWGIIIFIQNEFGLGEGSLFIPQVNIR